MYYLFYLGTIYVSFDTGTHVTVYELHNSINCDVFEITF